MPKQEKSTRPSTLRSPSAAVNPEVRPKRLGTPTVSRRKVRVTIGIDLGTSSTKVCFRRSDETRPTPYVCLFDENPAGYAPISLPSTVRVTNGKVYFAAEAERRAGGVAYRSFKTCLRCKLINRRCLHCGRGSQGLSPGQRMLPDGEGAVSAEELAAWYLAHVIALGSV